MLDTINDDGGASTDDVPLMHEAEDRDRAERAMQRVTGADELGVAMAHAIVGTWNTSTLARVLRAAERA
jgi:hypothetical protein